jgi:hypothetical protein
MCNSCRRFLKGLSVVMLRAEARTQGLSGALIGLGLPELEAKRYEAAIKKGRILVSVHSPDMRQAENARRLLEDSGAQEVFLSGERKAA